MFSQFFKLQQNIWLKIDVLESSGMEVILGCIVLQKECINFGTEQ